jgi:hypothetical protein
MGSAFSRAPVGCQWPVVLAEEEDDAELGELAVSLLEALDELEPLEALDPPAELAELEAPDPLDVGVVPDPVTNPPLAPTVPDCPPHPCVKASPAAVAHISVIFRIRRENARAPLIRMPEIVPSECIRGKAL